MRIETTTEPMSIDLKRCYLPIVIIDTCPKCGMEVSKHLSSDYLSYPRVNQVFSVSMYHHIEHEDRDEEHDWKVFVILRVSLEAAVSMETA
jgi:hypothetical protein